MKMLSRLERLEAESIHILREVVATCENPVMLYSIGKDSGVLLHLARKAFYPGPLPFPLLHVDTTWKFREMIEFRDRVGREPGTNLIVHINEEGVRDGIGPFASGSRVHTDVMKDAGGLKQALDKYKFDAAFGGARRGRREVAGRRSGCSRCGEAGHRWDPRRQRPEPWALFNTRKGRDESFRVFPLSNWTEADVWDYIAREGIEMVPLYFAKERPVVRRDGMLIMRDDDRMALLPGEQVEMMSVRFRSLGCYPLTGAVESEASTLEEIIAEMRGSTVSERSTRAIDHDGAGSMEQKKMEGYF